MYEHSDLNIISDAKRKYYINLQVLGKNQQKKSKVVPLRSIEGHLGDRRYSSYSFLTSALEGGEWSASRPGRALPPGKEPPPRSPLYRRVGGPQSRSGRRG
jgi:hypothetical protein